MYSNNKQGFTLLEVLVGMALTGILVTVMFSVSSYVASVYRHQRLYVEEVFGVYSFISRIKEDFFVSGLVSLPEPIDPSFVFVLNDDLSNQYMLRKHIVFIFNNQEYELFLEKSR